DFFQIPKIDDHSKLHMIGIINRSPDNRYIKFITMPVNIPAFSIITIKCMTCFKIEHLGNPYLSHIVKSECKDKASQRKIPKLKIMRRVLEITFLKFSEI